MTLPNGRAGAGGKNSDKAPESDKDAGASLDVDTSSSASEGGAAATPQAAAQPSAGETGFYEALPKGWPFINGLPASRSDVNFLRMPDGTIIYQIEE